MTTPLIVEIRRRILSILFTYATAVCGTEQDVDRRKYTMTKNMASCTLAFTIVCLCAGVDQKPAQCQQSAPQASTVVHQIMDSALARCFSSVDGVRRIEFRSPTNVEFAAITTLGESAVPAIASYLDVEPKDGLSQLIAVKFLISIGGTSTLQPLKHAVSADQWEVTRAQALSGLYDLSPEDAKPLIEVSLNDDSVLLRRRAKDLLALYEAKKN